MSLSAKERTRLKTKYGPWALVTGASSGIGRELAICLAEAGLHLLLVARRRPLLEDLARQLQAQHQVQVRIAEADVSEHGQVASILDAARQLEVGLLVAAAGFGTSGLFLGSDLKRELNMLAVNCGAVLMLTHHFSRRFAERGRGGIILMSSLVGFQGVPNAAHYAATKAYVQSLAEALAVELRPAGVDVLSAAPGPVHSGFAARAGMEMGMALKAEDIAVPILKSLGRRGTVLPGLLTKLLVGSLRTVPRWAKVRIMQQVMGGMTRHQRWGRE